ncbi:MAG: hypothetical protein ACYC6A_00045 [Armatimonadota bacterium]
MTQAHESRPWHPLIAQMLLRADIIERWSTGTLNIINWCRENHTPIPTWEARAGYRCISHMNLLSVTNALKFRCTLISPQRMPFWIVNGRESSLDIIPVYSPGAIQVQENFISQQDSRQAKKPEMTRVKSSTVSTSKAIISISANPFPLIDGCCGHPPQ